MKIRALLIDFDGVLVDSTRAYTKATTVTMNTFGYPAMTEEEVREKSLELARRFELGLPRDTLLDGIVPVVPSSITGFLDEWLRVWNEACLWEVEPIPGARETLVDLSTRFPLALVTLRHLKAALIEDQLKRLRYDSFFKTIITASDVKRSKPHPDPFLEGAKRLNIAVEDCAVVGDSIIDIRAGKSARMKTIAVLTGIHGENSLKLENPDLIIRNMTELPSQLE